MTGIDAISFGQYFCRYLLTALKDPKQDVFLTSDLYPDLRANVNINAPTVATGDGIPQAQNPQLGILTEAGHQIGGEFVFIRRPNATARPRSDRVGGTGLTHTDDGMPNTLPGKAHLAGRHAAAPLTAETQLPARFGEAFMLPSSGKNQHGNPVVTRKGAALGPRTGYPDEIWLRLAAIDTNAPRPL